MVTEAPFWTSTNGERQSPESWYMVSPRKRGMCVSGREWGPWAQVETEMRATPPASSYCRAPSHTRPDFRIDHTGPFSRPWT